MNTPKIKRYDRVFAIIAELNSLGCTTSKEKLLGEFAGGMKKGLRDLTEFEYDRFVQFLENKCSEARLSNDKVCNRQRRKIISIFAKMGYTIAVQTSEGIKVKSDMERIYVWVDKYGYLKKPLNKYNRKEIPKLVSQVEQIQKKEING